MDLKPLMQNKWLLALGILGVLCLLLGSFWNGTGRVLPTMASLSSANQNIPGPPGTSSGASSALEPTANVDATLTLQTAYQKQLAAILQKIAGIHHVNVMVTLDSSNTLEVANTVRKTTQTQVNGSERTESSSVDTSPYTQTVDGNQVPFVMQSSSPSVRGVLVTVAADDFYVAKAEIIDAITNVLDVPAYKISVEPEKVNS
ncbi:MAG: hypothetical protein K6T83_19165 [Alicyclobacillus sp.]|nr:hypothetical protein [Alicyclobacillus sp.]